MSELTRAETAALAAIDERALGRLLLDLLAVPSVTGTAAESELQHTLAGHLHGPCLILQGHVDVVPPGDLAQWPSDPFRPQEAGDWVSSVPDLLVAQGRLGVAIDESPEAGRLALERCVADACKHDPWLDEIPPPSHGMAARSAADGSSQATRFVIMSGMPTRPQPARLG
jgi:hypothetical protein